MYSIAHSLKSSSLSFFLKQAEIAIYLVSLFNRLERERLQSGMSVFSRKMNLQFVMSSASIQVVIHEISCLAEHRGCDSENLHGGLQAVFVVVVVLLLPPPCQYDNGTC